MIGRSRVRFPTGAEGEFFSSRVDCQRHLFAVNVSKDGSVFHSGL